MDGSVTGAGVVEKAVWNLEDDVEVWSLDDGVGVVVKAVWNLSLELTVTGAGGTAVFTSKLLGILEPGAVFFSPNLGC